MAIECDKLIETYVTWLRNKTQLRDIDGTCEITTPFMDRHNDRIQIYVQQKNGVLLLTDDGYTIGDLESNGCKIDSPHRKQMLQCILNGFAITHVNGELQAQASFENFPQKKHALVQAILAVNDMFMTAKHRVARFFREDVAKFLDDLEVRYSPDVAFQGKSSFTHHFDFLIPPSKKQPERILKAINHPNKEAATALIFSWTDTKDIRPPKSVCYAFLNDSERPLNGDVMSAFTQYDVKTVLWSQREQYQNALVM